MTVNDVIQKYSLEEILENDFNRYKVMIIKVAKSLDSGHDLYNATRYAWRVNIQKTKLADYILSVHNGVVKQVFVASEWLLDTPENFPQLANPDDFGRYGFIGSEVKERKVSILYKNKKLPQEYLKKGRANPIQYNF